MSKLCAVFYHGDRELFSYTVEGTFPEEQEATIALLSYEKGIPASEIRVAYEERSCKGLKRITGSPPACRSAPAGSPQNSQSSQRPG